MTAVQLCQLCARPRGVPAPEGCVCAGTYAERWKPKPAAPAGPAWGTDGERRHMAGECNPRTCRYCETARQMRGNYDGEGTA